MDIKPTKLPWVVLACGHGASFIHARVKSYGMWRGKTESQGENPGQEKSPAIPRGFWGRWQGVCHLGGMG